MIEQEVLAWLESEVRQRLDQVEHQRVDRYGSTQVSARYLMEEACLIFRFSLSPIDHLIRVEGQLKLSYGAVVIWVHAEGAGPKSTLGALWSRVELELAKLLKLDPNLRRIKRAKAHAESTLRCLEPQALLTQPKPKPMREEVCQGQLFG